MFSVVVLTYNEERNLPACLASLEGLPDQVFVVDSGSRDATLEIARAFGATLLSHPFQTHARQWEWALQQLPVGTEWVLGLDADQYLSDELRNELVQLFASGGQYLHQSNGFYIKRRQIFRGRWIRYGGYYPKYLLKLFRTGHVRLDPDDLMDHHFYVDGRVGKLKSDLIEKNRNEDDLGFWIAKHVRYAGLHAAEEFSRRAGVKPWPVQPAFFGSPDQRVAFFKRIWYRMPLFTRPVLYFGWRYFALAGFLDGREGFVFHFLQSWWYRLLVDIRLDELVRQDSTSGPDGL